MGNSLEEFIDNSQSYAARNIKEQGEFCRQRKYTPVGSMYLYFFSDPCAVIGSGLLDYFRRPYQKSYDVFKTIYTPVLVSLEWNKDPFIVGWQKTYNAGRHVCRQGLDHQRPSGADLGRHARLEVGQCRQQRGAA